MTNCKFYRSKRFVLGLLLMVWVSLAWFPAWAADNGEKADDDLKIYEKKSLFIFPILYNKGINSSILTGERKDFLVRQMFTMFVLDFRRIDFFDVKAGDSVETFLEDTHAYILKNVKDITVKRMQPDGKFKEAMVTGEELLKTTENSFALVPYIDSVEKEVVREKKSTSYVYNMYLHFDVYNTKTGEKMKTLKINNKKNWLGALSSVTGSLQVDNSDLEGLPESVQEDEKSFRSSLAGLFSVLKKQLKEMPEFCIMGELSMVNHTRFGFDMGDDTGIKIDHRYKTFVSRADGSRKMTGFGKIRKINPSYSEAQILIGRPGEGDQVMEDPKVGINVMGGFGTAPLHINLGDDIVTGSHKCLALGVEYELGPIMRKSEWYAALNLRIGLPSMEELYDTYFDYSVSQILVNLGAVKKIYWRRVALNFGGYLGIHSATISDNSSEDEMKGSSFGFTMNAGVEYMITPIISVFGGFTLDIYSNPSELDDSGSKVDFEDEWDWNARGLSLNFGVKFTL